MKRKLQLLIGLGVSALLIWILFRNTDWAEVRQVIADASPLWVLLTQVPIWGSFFARVLRWRYIVRSAKPVPFRTLFTATQIGFMANFVLPFRVGEVIRALILAKRGPVHFSKSAALVAMDRLSDFIGLGACAGITLLAFRITDVTLPPGTLSNKEPLLVPAALLRAGGVTMGIALAIMLVALLVIFFNSRLLTRVTDLLLGRVSPRGARQVSHLVEQFAEGLHVFRSATDLSLAAFWSLVTWGFFVLGAAATLKAFGLDCPWYTPFLLTTLTAVAVSIPGAPGFVGQYHMAVVVALVMVPAGILPDEAKAVAIILHLQNVFAVLVAGVISLMMENTGLIELSRQSAEANTAVEHAD